MGSMDSSHMALVSLLLRESAFSEFKCERPTSLGMNVDSLAKILKMCSPNDSLKVRWHSGADNVNFSKAAPLCGSVELGLGPDAPLMVKYDLENAENGHMQFYLAPKIDE